MNFSRFGCHRSSILLRPPCRSDEVLLPGRYQFNCWMENGYCRDLRRQFMDDFRYLHASSKRSIEWEIINTPAGSRSTMLISLYALWLIKLNSKAWSRLCIITGLDLIRLFLPILSAINFQIYGFDTLDILLRDTLLIHLRGSSLSDTRTTYLPSRFGVFDLG